VVTQVPGGELSPAEQALVDCVGQGELLDLLPEGEPVDEAAMRSWGDDRVCRAAVVRDILRGRLAADPDPHGLRLRGARIAGRLDLENLTTNVSLELYDCFLEEGIVARYARLLSLVLSGCRLEHPAEPPLDATGFTCSVFQLAGAKITGHGEAGAVDLVGAHIGGQLDCSGAQLDNDSGPALSASGLDVGQAVFLSGGFTATGHGEAGAVDLVGAHIGGQLSCIGAQLDNDSGPALSADSLDVGQAVFLSGGFTATGGGKYAAVDLTRTRAGGGLAFDPAGLGHAAGPRWRLAVDRLTYPGVPEPVRARGWLRLLRDGTPGYAAQPYQQLAAGCRALGDERRAREVLMAQRDDELAHGDTRWHERLWGKITKLTLGYGYQPWRALLFLAAVVALSCVLAVVLGAHGGLAQTKDTAAPGQPCTVTQQVSVGLDLNLPVGTTLARAGCGLPRDAASVTAAWLVTAGWALRVLAWVFAALFIAGFTGAVRKT
jgi:hypothetical protein